MGDLWQRSARILNRQNQNGKNKRTKRLGKAHGETPQDDTFETP